MFAKFVKTDVDATSFYLITILRYCCVLVKIHFYLNKLHIQYTSLTLIY